jgi:hypothetical protein
MEARFYLRISAAIFGIIGLGHLMRIIFGWPLVIGTLEVPMAVSWAGMIITATMVYWGVAKMPRNSQRWEE